MTPAEPACGSPTPHFSPLGSTIVTTQIEPGRAFDGLRYKDASIVDRELKHVGLDPRLPCMLYGSQARQSAGPRSDVDLLRVDLNRHGAHVIGKVHITTYRPETLRRMARSGSLFVRHLREEGVLLKDEGNLLSGILDDYRPPPSYAPLLQEVGAAAEALRYSSREASLVARLTNLGVYLARTALYARLAESDSLVFDADEAAHRIGLPSVRRVMSLRHSHDGRGLTLQEITTAIQELLGHAVRKQHASLPALALSLLNTHPHAGQLVEQVLMGSQLQYTALSHWTGPQHVH